MPLRSTIVLLLGACLLNGCEQGASTAPDSAVIDQLHTPASSQVTEAGEKAPNPDLSIRPRFSAGLEKFILEARAFANLPSTGASVNSMREQLAAMQQAFARVSDPQSKQETLIYAKAKMVVATAPIMMQFYELYARSLEFEGDLADRNKNHVDENAEEIKEKISELEKLLDAT